MTNHIVTTLGGLTAGDQGHQVTVRGLHATIVGILMAFEVEQAWIDVTEMSTPPDERPLLIRGVQRVRISVGEWSAEDLPLNTPVEIDR